MERSASQKRMRCSECPLKREMARRARLRAGSENSRRDERLNHHDRTPMNAEKIRLKFLNWWKGLLFLWLIMIGTRLFGCIAISRGEDGNPRAIHFALDRRAFNISIRSFVDQLDRSYLKRR